MFTNMTNAWDVINKDPNIDKYLNKNKITKQIDELKNIFSNEGIVY